jgi:hypothetical protein
MIYKIHKIKDRATQTLLKTGGEFRGSGRVGSSRFTCDICRVTLVTNPVISHERGKDCSKNTKSKRSWYNVNIY